jgi:type IV pilus assembly protein PilX
VTNAAQGYYSNYDPSVNLTDGSGIKWDNTDSALLGTDGAGNEIRYIVQRMCRFANTPLKTADCLYSEATTDTNGRNVPVPQDICYGDGCPAAGQSPMLRVTIRSKGPKNSLSYLQAFIY